MNRYGAATGEQRPTRSAIYLDEQRHDEEIKTESAYEAVIGYCRPVLAGFESRAERMRRYEIAIAIIGTLAGSVAVPMLTTASAAGNAAWIAGLGGTAGAANALQQTFRNAGIGSVDVLRNRQIILEQLRQALSEYYGGATTEQRLLALEKATGACALYDLTIPDQATANTSTTTTSTTLSPPTT